MSVIIFLLILSILVVVHELGHFLAARIFSIRVEEFGLGYPPRARALFKKWGTTFTLNWLPFGGFVKIFGEDPNDENKSAPESFQSKGRGIQAAVLAAGVFFNLVFAWLLISVGLISGLPAPAGTLPIEAPRTVITTVIPASPAAQAGLKSGDAIISIGNVPVSPQEAAVFISHSSGALDFVIERGKEVLHKKVTPAPNPSGVPMIGIAMEVIGTAKLPFFRAFYEGGKITYELTKTTGRALAGFIGQAVTGRANLAEVTGPIGLVGVVGDARALGLGYLLSLTALISLNLSLINLLPLPALDGGRLLFVLIEAVSRKRIPSRLFNALNAAGFALLIFLMILVTLHDVRVIL